MLLTSASPTENTKLKDPFIKEYSISFFILEKTHTVPGTVSVVKWIPACVNISVISTQLASHCSGDGSASKADCLLLSSGEEHALLHSPRVRVSCECGPCHHCFCIFWQIQKRVPCTQHVLCNDSQPTQTEMKKLHVHLRMTTKLRQTESPSQSGKWWGHEKLLETRNEEQSGRLHQESQKWGHRAKGHGQAEQCHSPSPASTCWQGEELLVDWVKTAGTTRKKPQWLSFKS